LSHYQPGIRKLRRLENTYPLLRTIQRIDRLKDKARRGVGPRKRDRQRVDLLDRKHGGNDARSSGRPPRNAGREKDQCSNPAGDGFHTSLLKPCAVWDSFAPAEGSERQSSRLDDGHRSFPRVFDSSK
jgi:hypothetical protein